MLGRSFLFAAFAGFAGFALQARAQNSSQPTVDQLQSCFQSIDIDFDAEVTYDTTDNTHYFNRTWTYNSTACTQPAQVAVGGIVLENEYSGERTVCTKPPFDQTGVLYSQCSTTLGAMAQEAEAGDDSFFVTLTVGQRPAVRVQTFYFTVVPYTPPVASGASVQRRRRARALAQLPFKCEKGFSYCPTSPKTFGCVNTSTNLNSCGACPSDPLSKDCSSIDGADHVECRNGGCIVNSCLRGYQVSPDRKSCRRYTSRR